MCQHDIVEPRFRILIKTFWEASPKGYVIIQNLHDDDLHCVPVSESKSALLALSL